MEWTTKQKTRQKKARSATAQFVSSGQSATVMSTAYYHQLLKEAGRSRKGRKKK